MSLGIVYCILNKVNQKFYVGKTVKTIERRFNEHVNLSRKSDRTRLSKAIRKYGRDSFSIEIIDTADKEILHLIEMIYINEFSPAYNMTGGGEGTFGLIWITNGEDTKRVDAAFSLPT